MTVLASADIAADTTTLVYTCPASKRAAVSINLCARVTAALVSIAIVGSGDSPSTPDAADWLEYEVSLQPGGTPLLREGILLGDGDLVYVLASANDVSAVVYGLEEDI